jgi:hypothetical protein
MTDENRNPSKKFFRDIIPCNLLKANQLHNIISQKTELFTATSVRTSNPTENSLLG